MQKTIEDKWDVQLSEEEMKLLSEFKAADQILFSLKILVVKTYLFRALTSNWPIFTNKLN